MQLWVQCANPSPNRNPVLYAAVGTVRKPEPNIIRNPVRYAAVGTVRKPEP